MPLYADKESEHNEWDLILTMFYILYCKGLLYKLILQQNLS